MIRGNLISGVQGYGICITTSAVGTHVESNTLGTDPFGNLTDSAGLSYVNSTAGIVVDGFDTGLLGIVIGGSTPDKGNIIAGDSERGGVRLGRESALEAPRGVSIFGNIIYANLRSEKIRFDGNASAEDSDAGYFPTFTNSGVNTPVITRQDSDNGSTRIEGYIPGSHASVYRVELFADPSNGAPIQFLSAVTTTPDSNGIKRFSATLPFELKKGYAILATGTDADGDTSRYSHPIAIVGVPAIPTGLAPTQVANKNQINLDWKDNSNYESGFRLVRYLADSTFAGFVHKDQEFLLPANTTHFEDTTYPVGQALFYSIQAYNDVGISQYEKIVEIDPTVPAPVLTSVRLLRVDGLYYARTYGNNLGDITIGDINGGNQDTTLDTNTPPSIIDIRVPTDLVVVGSQLTITALNPTINNLNVSNALTLTIQGATDVTSQIQIARGGFRLNKATGRFTQTVILKNIGANMLSGPVALVLDNLLPGNSFLYNRTGRAQNGSGFIDVGSDIASGQSVTVTLDIADPTKAAISYTARVMAGNGPP